MTASATTNTATKSAAELIRSRGEFVNEAFTDFSKPENRKAMEDALRHVKSMFGREYPLVIAGQNLVTTDKIKSTNPSNP